MSTRGVEVTMSESVVVARLVGDIDLANTPSVSSVVLESVPNDALGLVVDLSGVRYIDSVGIRMLFTFVRLLHASRQGLAVAVPPESPVRKLLKITHLDEAIVALREGGTPQY